MNRFRALLLSAFIVACVLALNTAAWWWLNRPVPGPEWLGIARGLSFNPFQMNQRPQDRQFPTPEQIEEDIRLIAPYTEKIRTYSVLDGLDVVPALARRHGLVVTLGAWIDSDKQRNEQEVLGAIRIASTEKSIDRIIVGNESVLRKDVTVDELIGYVRRVKTRVRLPVSTAEPWHVWLAHPELANEVDFIAIHTLPYWEGVPARAGVEFVLERYRDIQRAFPGKPILIAEVGWPSDGPPVGLARPGPVRQATFLREFVTIAAAQWLDYYVVEAFDQPWKLRSEGTAGAYWGLFNAKREMKLGMVGPMVPVREWRLLAALSGLAALGPILLFLAWETGLRLPGRFFYTILIQVLASAGVGTAYVLASKYATPETRIVWSVLSAALVLVVVIAVSEGLEFARALWRRRLARGFPVEAPSRPAVWPKVSIHVPMYNEPPQMIRETLDALAALDYPDFEVIAIDNNTKDPAIWKPVEDHCARLGPSFRFLHLDRCPGFKAGALNYALAHTAKDAEIVAVIDSDYVVAADWLKSLIPYLEDGKVGFVQAPQDYRDWRGNAFKEMCNWEYAGFFHIGMVERNERNAIIQHGTMTLIRKPALEAVGGWAEWCITEDAELGLKLLKAGYDSVYVNESYGQGLTPDTFSGYKSQRFRWAYGAIQILKRYWRPLLLGRPGALTRGQRYHFLIGWLPWIADALNVFFTAAALVWSVVLILWPRYVDFPLPLFLIAAVAVVGCKTLESLILYGAKIKCSGLQNLGATIAGLSLSHTVGKAVISGMLTSDRPFLRTPKLETKPAVLRAVGAVWEEAAMLVLLWGTAVLIAVVHDLRSPEAVLWIAVLGLQSLTYLAALTMSTVNVVTARRVPAPARISVVAAAGAPREEESRQQA